MKKRYFCLCLLVLLSCFGFFACKQATLPENNKGMSAGGPSSNSAGWGAPANFTVSHGLYRRIELSWTAVRGAHYYQISWAKSPNDTFWADGSVWKTTDATPSCILGESQIPDNAGLFYRVRAVNDPSGDAVSGDEIYGPESLIQYGTTLAKPQIYLDEDGSGINWQMNNFRDGSEYSSYESKVCYEVYYRKNDDSGEDFTLAATFTPNEEGVTTANWRFENNLDSGTRYRFKVRAYLVDNPGEYEEQTVDEATLNNETAGVVSDFAVSSGMYPDKIAIKFTTPPYVETNVNADKDNAEPNWQRRSVYFEVRRSLAGLNLFETVTPTGGIGAEIDEYKVYAEGTKDDPSLYGKGNVITVFDTTGLKSGEVYDYEIISWSDLSTHDEKSDRKGEKTEILSASMLRHVSSLNTVTTEKVVDGTTGSETISFQTDWVNITEPVSFTLSKEVKEGNATRSFGEKTVLAENLTINADGFVCKEDGSVFTYEQEFNQQVVYLRFTLTGKYNGENPAEFTDLGEVSKSTNEILFTTTPAPYLNRMEAVGGFISSSKISMFGVDPVTGLGCDFEEDVEYTLFYGVDGDLSNEFTDIKSSTFTLTGLEGGKTYSAKLQAMRKGLKTETPEVTFTTLGTPVINVPYGNHSYDQIKVEWTETPAAEYYILKYTNADGEETVSSEIKPSDFTGTDPVAYNNISVTRLGDKYTALITHPDATDHLKSGKTLTVKVEAAANEATESFSSTNLFGPAEIDLYASKAVFYNAVELGWNHLNGAKAYRIYRFRTDEIMDQYVVYFDEKSENWVISLGGTSLIEDSDICSLSFSNDRFVFTDKTVFDSKKSVATKIAGEMYGSWVENQMQMAWDTAFEYRVIPHFTRNISQVKYNLEDVSTESGYVLGYPTNLTVSRGYDEEYSVGGDSVTINSVLNSTELNKAVFDKIRISWDCPMAGSFASSLPSGGYRIYRRKVGTTSWENISNPLKDITTYLDTTAQPYTMYDYMVVAVAGNGNVTPDKDSAYVASLEKAGNNRGYKLGSITMNSVSRNRSFSTESDTMVLTPENSVALTKNGKKTFQELVSWRVLGDDNSQNQAVQPSGFIVEVQNNDIDEQFRVIADLPLTVNQQARSNVAYNAVLSTFGFDGKKSGDAAYNTGLDMLKVLTDYKHTFRVRAYVTDAESGRRSYSAASNTAWGAREITNEEFARAAGEVMRPAIHYAADLSAMGPWQSHWNSWYRGTPSGMSGYIYSRSSSGVGMWAFIFDSVKGNFMTITGKIGAESQATGHWPRYYFTNLEGSVNGSEKGGGGWTAPNFISPGDTKAKPNYDDMTDKKFSDITSGDDITIVGPSDVNGMYSGDIVFTDVGVSSGGSLTIKYNGTSVVKYDGFAKYMNLPNNTQ